jgi:hypothetical protein
MSPCLSVSIDILMFGDRVVGVYFRNVIVFSIVIPCRSPKGLIIDINIGSSTTYDPREQAIEGGNCYAREGQSTKQENELGLFHSYRPFMAMSEHMPFRETFNSYPDWKRRLERRDNAESLSDTHYS